MNGAGFWEVYMEISAEIESRLYTIRSKKSKSLLYWMRKILHAELFGASVHPPTGGTG
jgi:hypothetical protein